MDEQTKEFYKQYPDMFLENVLDLKLHWYQKVFLRVMIRTKKQVKHGNIK
jgi:hypothetical protein